MKTIKFIYILFLLILFSLSTQAQVKIGDNPTTIESSAVFEIESTDQGLLPPRMTDAQMTAINTPADGLMVFCTDCNPKGFYFFDGTDWTQFGGGGDQLSADCSANGLVGNLSDGSATFSVTVTNRTLANAPLTFSTADLSLSGVSGVTVTGVSPANATLAGAGASQLVTYTLGGTPASAGTLTIDLDISGLATCTATAEVSSSNGTAVISNYCSAAFITGTMTQGQSASGTTLTLEPNVTQLGTYDISATQNGVTFSASGTFTTTGCQTLVLTAVGSPVNNGTFTWTTNTIPAESASATIAILIPSSISLRQDQQLTVASLYDEDYMPYTTPTGPATTATVAADGTPDLTVDVQYTFTTAGVEINIPVASATGSGTLPAYSQTVQVPANLTEDGVARDLELSWQSQSYTNTTGFIEAKITAIGGNLLVKKLDINAGIGNDYRGVLLASFIYPYNASGNTDTFEVRAMSGILDRYFGVVMNYNNNNPGPFYHDFIYLPITGAAGRTWLNQNLGSNYSNVRHAAFNPAQQATGLNDADAFGSKFQWGRQADGHEIYNPRPRTSNLANVWKTIGTQWEGKLCTSSHWGFWAWYTNNFPNYWNPGMNNNNDPCPEGFRVPNKDEFQDEFDAAYANIDNLYYQWETMWFGSPLKPNLIRGSSYDSGNNVWKTQGGDMNYWTTSYENNNGNYKPIYFMTNRTWRYWSLGSTNPEVAFAVRCIQDQ